LNPIKFDGSIFEHKLKVPNRYEDAGSMAGVALQPEWQLAWASLSGH